MGPGDRVSASRSVSFLFPLAQDSKQLTASGIIKYFSELKICLLLKKCTKWPLARPLQEWLLQKRKKRRPTLRIYIRERFPQAVPVGPSAYLRQIFRDQESCSE